MSDPVTNLEIEDVLASIRRLVSGGDRPHAAPQPAAAPQPDRLVLTPALRVMSPEAPAAGPDAYRPVTPELVETAGVWRSELSLSSQFAHRRLEEKIAALEAAVTRQHDDWEPDGSEKPDDAGAATLTLRMAAAAAESDQAPDRAAAPLAWAAPEPEASLPGPLDGDQALSDADLADPDSGQEALLQAGRDFWQEPAPEEQPGPTPATASFHHQDWAGFSVLPQTIAAPAAAAPEAAAAPQPAPETAAAPAETLAAETAAAEPEAAADEDAAFYRDDLEDEPSGSVFDEDDLAAYLDSEGVIDEGALRDFVLEVIRQELQGALGERITRNVRKLVRREIYRALASENYD